jgi:ribonuclease HII
VEQLLFSCEQRGTICGLDEAGRGPLAGPVVAAAVVLCDDFPIHILGDSKKLSEMQRQKAEEIIKQQALYWSVGIANSKEIDRINILEASLLAMKRAYQKIRELTPIHTALVDGNKIPDLDCPTQAIIKGDATVPEIMAASILAKNQRDRYMVLCDKKWPLYDFATHKGYPTKKHREACLLYGLCPIHRRTFSIKNRKDSQEQQLLW